MNCFLWLELKPTSQIILVCLPHKTTGKTQEHPPTVQKNPTTLFSDSIAGPTKSDPAKQAQIFPCLVIAKLDFTWITLYLAPKWWLESPRAKPFAVRHLLYLAKGNQVQRYVVLTLSVLWEVIWNLKNKFHSGFFVTYALSVSMERVCMCVCVRVYTHMPRCDFAHVYAFIAFLCYLGSLFPDLGKYRDRSRL